MTWRCPVPTRPRPAGLRGPARRYGSGWRRGPRERRLRHATSPSATTSSVTWRGPVATRPRPGGTTKDSLTIAQAARRRGPRQRRLRHATSPSATTGSVTWRSSGGDPAAARRYYEDGLTIRKRLADAAPDNADYARDLSVSYNKLGDLAMSGGDPAAARRILRGRPDDREAAGRRSTENADYAATSPSATIGSVTWRCPVATRLRPGGTTRTA